MAKELDRPPLFTLIKSQTGDMVTESTALTLVAWPVSEQFDPQRKSRLAFYWTGDNLTPGDEVDFELLLWDGIAGTYVHAGYVNNVLADSIVITPIFDAATAVLRIHDVSGVNDVSGMNATIYAASYNVNSL